MFCGGNRCQNTACRQNAVLRQLSRCVSVNDALRDVALGAAAVHGLLFYVAVRLRLGHSAALDEQAFRPVDEADILDAPLEAAVFVLQSAQTAARGACHAKRLHEQHA